MQLKLNGIDGYSAEVFTDLGSVEPFWRVLEAGATQPFARFSWASACTSVQQAKASWSPLIVVICKDGSPRMILPLQLHSRWPLRRARWLCDRLSDYNTPLLADDLPESVATELAAAAFSSLAKAPWRVDAIHLLRQPADPILARGFVAGRLTETAEHGSHLLELDRDWSKLFASLRSSRSRRRLREKQKALAKLGSVCFRRVRAPAERAAVARQVMRWKSQQLAARGSRNPFEGVAPLSTAILATLDDDTSGMHVYGLFVNGNPVAGMIAFADRHSFSMLVTAYDPKAGVKTSPGTTLLLKTIELSARAGIARYDHLYGDEPYKTEWSDRRITLHHGFEPLTLLGWLDCLAAIAGLRLKKWIMRQPRALAAIQEIRRRLILNATPDRPQRDDPSAAKPQYSINAASSD